MKRAIIWTIAALAVASGPALAHPGHEAPGFLHPFTGLDHLLAMVAVGVWAAFLGEKRPSAAWLVPAAFLTMMAIGAAAGFAGTKLPLAEAIILASVFALGALVLVAVRIPTAVAMAVVGLFALFHGYAHAAEAPAGGMGSYALGFLAATALLHALGWGLGRVARNLVGTPGLRALGGMVMLGGAFLLAAN